MFLPSFRHLIEIEALKRENQQNLVQILSEKKRICDLEERRKKSKEQIEELLQEEKELKLQERLQVISSLEARISKLNSQSTSAQTEKEQHAFESQLSLAKSELEKEENLYLQLLEKSEAGIKKREELSAFLEGSLLSLEEIKKEVEKATAGHELIINNRMLRINALYELMAPALRSLYQEIEIKFKNKAAVSYLLDKKCSECHMQVDSMLKNALEEGRSIEICPSCGRLLIPETAKIY